MRIQGLADVAEGVTHEGAPQSSLVDAIRGEPRADVLGDECRAGRVHGQCSIVVGAAVAEQCRDRDSPLGVLAVALLIANVSNPSGQRQFDAATVTERQRKNGTTTRSIDLYRRTRARPSSPSSLAATAATCWLLRPPDPAASVKPATR